eukprot:1244000-Pleurochrysis_carterae.AAC.2
MRSTSSASKDSTRPAAPRAVAAPHPQACARLTCSLDSESLRAKRPSAQSARRGRTKAKGARSRNQTIVERRSAVRRPPACGGLAAARARTIASGAVVPSAPA